MLTFFTYTFLFLSYQSQVLYNSEVLIQGFEINIFKTR